MQLLKSLKNIFSFKEEYYVPSEEKIVTDLATDNEPIIDTLFSISKDKLSEDESQRRYIEQKALNVIQLTSVIMSFLITGVTFLFKEFNGKESKLLSSTTLIVLMAIFATYLLLIFLSWQALRARSNFRTTAYEDLLKIEENYGEREAEKKTDIVYKRYLIASFWVVYFNNDKITSKKAKYLIYVFNMFLAFMMLVCTLVFVIGLKAYQLQENIMSKDNSQPTSNTATTATTSNTKPVQPTSLPSAGQTTTRTIKPTNKPTLGKTFTEGNKSNGK